MSDCNHNAVWCQCQVDELTEEIARLREVHLRGCECTADEACAFARERDALRTALADAVEGMADMVSYIQPKSAEAWGYDGYLARAQAALERK